MSDPTPTQAERETAILTDFWAEVDAKADAYERVANHIAALPAEIRGRLIGGAS